ncbi:MAG: hypothetical protein M0015_14085 [Betaproteobacteria bacterium]|nr:hypothetical protein [Betaproteobacteria bacterium]
MSALKWVAVAAAAAAAFGLAGCGEHEQVVVYKQGKYQGKPDTLPWDNAPLAWGTAKWEKGNEKSWEDELKSRTQNQNEYVRIQHY